MAIATQTEPIGGLQPLLDEVFEDEKDGQESPLSVVEEMYDQAQQTTSFVRRRVSKNSGKSKKFTKNATFVSSHDHTFISADGARVSFVTAKETEAEILEYQGQ